MAARVISRYFLGDEISKGMKSSRFVEKFLSRPSLFRCIVFFRRYIRRKKRGINKLSKINGTRKVRKEFDVCVCDEAIINQRIGKVYSR